MHRNFLCASSVSIPTDERLQLCAGCAYSARSVHLCISFVQSHAGKSILIGTVSGKEIQHIGSTFVNAGNSG